MTKTCILLKHGLCISQTPTGINEGVCCYNRKTNYKSDIVNEIDCKVCMDEEKVINMRSYRQGVNEEFSEYINVNTNEIVVLDITPNLTCNLTCKICDEASSSSWAKLKKIPIDKSYNLSFDNFTKVLDTYNLSNLKTINFSGGEPFLNNNLIKYINLLADKTDFSKINLRFSTNGTVRLNDDLSNFFNQFKLVLARFSLDDIGAGHEYHRYPANWKDWENNWKYFLSNFPVNVIPSINRSVGLLNLNRLHLLDSWHRDYQFTKLSDQIELIDHFVYGPTSIDHISQSVKDHILSAHGSSSRAWKYISNRIPGNINLVLDYITNIDKLHQQSFEEYDSEMYRILFKK
jgi:hypothetical protein